MNGMPPGHGAPAYLSFHALDNCRDGLKTWNLGVEGTWAELNGINNFGVAVGFGDVGGDPLRMVGVSLYGPNTGKWFDGGVSSADSSWWMTEAGRVSDTGLIVGSIADANGNPMAHLWTPNQPGIDLGALAGDCCGSVAIDINHSGTLIVGLSLFWTDTAYGAHPVAWTPVPTWHQGRLTVTWQIHPLPTAGLEQSGAVFPESVGPLNWWGGWGVNDLGQIVGDAWDDSENEEIAVVWTPVGGGQGWEVQQLPHQSSVGYVSDHYWTQALAIDNLGEIAGNASIDVAPGNDVVTLWRMSPRTHTWEMIELPTLSGARCGNNDAWAINDVGDVVGSSTPVCDPDPKNWTVNATRWTTNNLRFVKSIGISADWSTAHGVNNLGIAVGKFGNNSDGSDLPFAAAIR